MSTPLPPIPAEAMRLNAICPYFTMFPLDFPLGVLASRAKDGDCVLDPFCGRGTTNFAARLLGLRTVGIDASRVAAVAARARLAGPTPERIIETARAVLTRRDEAADVPEGEFWCLAYHGDVLRALCRTRSALLDGSVEEDTAAALRGIVLGALHGPVGRTKRSYFSNQCPRTFGPKPAYAVRFWKARKLLPPRVDVLGIIAERAWRYYGRAPPRVSGSAIEGDSRDAATVAEACDPVGGIDWVVTSPPYYGLRTYPSDQWIRNWFLGGAPRVHYTSGRQLSHNGRDRFVADLRAVWTNIGRLCRPGARLVVRFGAIGDRMVDDPAGLVAASVDATGWAITDIRHADNAARGRRQADTFQRARRAPRDEVDVWARWHP